jgi:hypothetical protein
VTGVGLNTKLLQKKVMKDTGFVLRNIRFDDVTVGTQELCVKYLEFTDLKVQIMAGPPTKLEYMDPAEVSMWYISRKVLPSCTCKYYHKF